MQEGKSSPPLTDANFLWPASRLKTTYLCLYFLLWLYFDRPVMLGVFQALLKMTGFPIESTGVCQSQTCLLTAASILHDIDTTADPCADFYQYSCT